MKFEAIKHMKRINKLSTSTIKTTKMEKAALDYLRIQWQIWYSNKCDMCI